MNTLLLITLLTAPSQYIALNFFYSPDCGHCMDILLRDIPELQKKYKFMLKKYDLNFIENYKLLEKMEQKVREPGEDLPVIFIGDSVFYGPEEIKKSLESTLKLLTVKKTKPADTSNIQKDTTDSKEIKNTGVINLYYFYMPRCKECTRTKSLLKALQKQYPGLRTYEYNTLEDSCKLIFEALAIKYNIPQQKRLIVPTIFIGTDYLIKEEITSKILEQLFQKYKEGSPVLNIASLKPAETSIIARFSRFSILGIIIAGLIDGINPCAFATFIFFVSYLLFIGRRRRVIALAAVFFILGLFISYFAIGLGAFNILKYLTQFVLIARIIFIVFGLLALALGIFSLRDYFVARRGAFDKMILQLPLKIKQMIHKDLKQKTRTSGIILGALLSGFIVSFLEFGCTGQVYLPTITFMISRSDTLTRPIFALLLYNLMFILPLIIIACFASFFSSQWVAHIMEKNVAPIKLLTTLLFFGLGILLIASAW